MTRQRDIPQEAYEFRFIKAQGPGGQHVNKTNSAVELRVAVAKLGLPAFAERQIREQQRNRISSQGVLIIQAEQHRSQQRNRDAALDRLQDMILRAMIRPKKRIATRPSNAQKKRRADNKKRRGELKASRRRPDF
ncbi:MAG: alternative ribosome rescue aminoacyl-tRNA hydrolase ArfB [Pseudomonadota bacterium]